MEKSENKIKGKILLIEDDQQLAKMVKTFLSKKGYIVQVCYDATQAIEILGVSSKTPQGFKAFLP